MNTGANTNPATANTSTAPNVATPPTATHVSPVSSISSVPSGTRINIARERSLVELLAIFSRLKLGCHNDDSDEQLLTQQLAFDIVNAIDLLHVARSAKQTSVTTSSAALISDSSPCLKLPQELLLRIFELLQDHPNALYSCSLVCQSWNLLTKGILWRCANFPNADLLRKFVKCAVLSAADDYISSNSVSSPLLIELKPFLCSLEEPIPFDESLMKAATRIILNYTDPFLFDDRQLSSRPSILFRRIAFDRNLYEVTKKCEIAGTAKNSFGAGHLVRKIVIPSTGKGLAALALANNTLTGLQW
ncbi:hypothetical protein HK096_002777 [Nowakowskiella sp. JEL0078]|nr:hypothetical protein HK096_002777 [Nowakowskiella sp. JEL0078]